MSTYLELSKKDKQALLYESACNYLSRREHSRFELKEKIKKKFKEAENNEIEEVLEFLVEKNLQSDARFLDDFVESSIQKGHGPGKIKFTLRSKKVNTDSLDKYFEKYDFEKLAKDLIKKRYHTELKEYSRLSYEDKQKLKAKIQRFLFTKGYSSETKAIVISSISE